MSRRSRACSFLLSSAALLSSACSDSPVGAVSNSADVHAHVAASAAAGAGLGASAKVSADAEPSPLADAPLAAAQSELLDIAFGAASAFPLQPHLKNRSRAQQAVVDACLQLDQPRRAREYLERIGDWRRAAALADLAFWSAQHGDTTQVQADLDRALALAAQDRGEDAQDWQRDRIRAGVARTYLVLGRQEDAAALMAGATVSELGRVAAVEASRADAAACDAQLAALDQVVLTGGFDAVRGALEGCAQLFDVFYTDSARRARIEQKLKASWHGLPVQLRIELLDELAEHALDHADPPAALALVNEAQALLVGTSWTPDVQIALAARLAGLRHRAGDAAGARREADAALALFAAQRERIVDIDRADSLRPLAEAYLAMGAAPSARSVYGLAVEESVLNPNSRPRADDLAATCCSMALHGFSPDAPLLARLRQIRDGLGDPW